MYESQLVNAHQTELRQYNSTCEESWGFSSRYKQGHLSQGLNLMGNVFGRFEEVGANPINDGVGGEISGKHLGSVLQMPSVTLMDLLPCQHSY